MKTTTNAIFCAFLGAWMLALLGQVHAQVLTVEPVFPTADDTITIVYNAGEGNGELAEVSPIYAHTGVITNESNGPSDWKNVKSDWGTTDPNVLMTDLGDNLHQIRYHIRSYYGVDAGITIEELAFVFRNADGSLVGRSETGGDLYYPVYDGSVLALAFLTPNPQNLIFVGDTLPIKTAVSAEGTLELLVNDDLISSATGKSLNLDWVPTEPGEYWIKLQVTVGQQVESDSIFVGVIGDTPIADLPQGVEPGITYLSDTSVLLSLYAPGKEYALLIGDMNEWRLGPSSLMNQTSDGTHFWAEVHGLTPGEEYAFQYVVDGNIRIADPYTEKVLDPWNDPFIDAQTYPDLKPYPTENTTGIVSVLQTAQAEYVWQNEIERPDPGDLIIYELLVRDFLEAHNYETLIDSLDYLERLGVNAIELMPVNEFEGNISWGYNPSFYFAPDKYYGTEEALKAFVDSCHGRGIVVILDMVLNHAFGQSPYAQLYWDPANSRPSADNPWLNPIARHPFNVGYDFNHDSEQTQILTDRVLKYWLEEYRMDGFRMDLSKGFTQNFTDDVGAWSAYDQSRIDHWIRIYDEMRTVDQDAYLVLEHFGDNSEEKILAEYGMMFWGNLNHTYNEAAMGYNEGNNSNFDWVFHQTRDWSVPHLIGYMESHDEERLMVRNLQFGDSNGDYDTRDAATAMQRIGMASAFFYTIPGPKMLWQFGEMGYDISIDENGRTGPKPILWNYLEDPDRAALFETTSRLIHLRRSQDIFKTDDVNLSLAGDVKRIGLKDEEMDLIVIGNFGLTIRQVNPNFPQSGIWYDFMSGDSMEVNAGANLMPFEPGEWRIYSSVRLSEPDTTNQPQVLTPPTDEPYLLPFPNPGNGTLTFRLGLPYSGRPLLEIFDLSGRRVAQIPERLYEEAGVYDLEWDLSALTGGLYVVRMLVRDDVATTKLLIR
ncbi:MAG: alpha-amylase family glycosyl hydrolase [Bacteroidota bacterium]